MPRSNDAEVLDPVRALIDQREYLDEIPGRPGEHLGGGGAFKSGRGSTMRRIYWRGSQEYLDAKAAGVKMGLDSAPPPPASHDDVVTLETKVQYPLPPLLRRLYVEVANGGFGPGYGLLPVGRQGSVGPPDGSLDRYLDADDVAVPALLEVCDWGCGISSYVDCAHDGAMWGLDPNPVDISLALFPQEYDFSEWLARWIDGRLNQPWAVQDPDTGQWRGATADEAEAALASEP